MALDQITPQHLTHLLQQLYTATTDLSDINRQICLIQQQPDASAYCLMWIKAGPPSSELYHFCLCTWGNVLHKHQWCATVPSAVREEIRQSLVHQVKTPDATFSEAFIHDKAIHVLAGIVANVWPAEWPDALDFMSELLCSPATQLTGVRFIEALAEELSSSTIPSQRKSALQQNWGLHAKDTLSALVQITTTGATDISRAAFAALTKFVDWAPAQLLTDAHVPDLLVLVARNGVTCNLAESCIVCCAEIVDKSTVPPNTPTEKLFTAATTALDCLFQHAVSHPSEPACERLAPCTATLMEKHLPRLLAMNEGMVLSILSSLRSWILVQETIEDIAPCIEAWDAVAEYVSMEAERGSGSTSPVVSKLEAPLLAFLDIALPGGSQCFTTSKMMQECATSQGDDWYNGPVGRAILACSKIIPIYKESTLFSTNAGSLCGRLGAVAGAFESDLSNSANVMALDVMFQVFAALALDMLCMGERVHSMVGSLVTSVGGLLMKAFTTREWRYERHVTCVVSRGYGLLAALYPIVGKMGQEAAAGAVRVVLEAVVAPLKCVPSAPEQLLSEAGAVLEKYSKGVSWGIDEVSKVVLGARQSHLLAYPPRAWDGYHAGVATVLLREGGDVGSFLAPLLTSFQQAAADPAANAKLSQSCIHILTHVVTSVGGKKAAERSGLWGVLSPQAEAICWAICCDVISEPACELVRAILRHLHKEAGAAFEAAAMSQLLKALQGAGVEKAEQLQQLLDSLQLIVRFPNSAHIREATMLCSTFLAPKLMVPTVSPTTYEPFLLTVQTLLQHNWGLFWVEGGGGRYAPASADSVEHWNSLLMATLAPLRLSTLSSEPSVLYIALNWLHDMEVNRGMLHRALSHEQQLDIAVLLVSLRCSEIVVHPDAIGKLLYIMVERLGHGLIERAVVGWLESMATIPATLKQSLSVTLLASRMDSLPTLQQGLDDFRRGVLAALPDKDTL